MGDHDNTRTCLSAEVHEDRHVSDKVLHYLGCLEFCEREQYYRELDDVHQKQVESVLRRIQYLRHVFEQEDDEGKPLIAKLRRSIESWKASEFFRSGVAVVQAWRSKKSRRNSKWQRDPRKRKESSTTSEISTYDPDRDHNAYFIRYVQSRPVIDLEHPGFNGQFPNHKIAVSRLLDEKEDSNPLNSEVYPEKGINYFHFPANNMHWIERAIARYFNEDDPEYDGISGHISAGEKTKTYAVLRPEFWKGQQHSGQSSSVHARHLRPLCETVSSDPTQVQTAPRNMVLFMPYLHWETDRQREKLSQALDLESERHQYEKQKTELSQMRERQREREKLAPPDHFIQRKSLALEKHLRRSQNPSRHANTALLQGSSYMRSGIYTPFKRGKLTPTTTKLGQVLLDAATLYEAMTNYRDKRLIQKYLCWDPPLHPRRTLDQAYYWTMKTTNLRDRDQVVYRGTSDNPDFRHRLRPRQQQQQEQHNCLRWGTQVSKSTTSDCTGSLKWDCEEGNIPRKMIYSLEASNEQPTSTGHQQAIVDNRCFHCREHICKVSRAVMVDQLWMWILDDQTIITCFPQRYGVNKRDPSGVHKCIRTRIKSLREDHIRTVFDLALIILAECSNMFFNRAKIEDRQPEVLNIFSESIGNVNYKQSISFDRLWQLTGRLGTFARPGQLRANLSDFVMPLLNINKEGKLQREIKDIIDEIDIMIYISTQQRDVIKKFKKEVTRKLDPDGIWRHKWNVNPTNNSKDEGDKKRHGDYFWFVNTADDLLGDLEDHLGELEALRKSAESTSTSLDQLLNIKQQQASVFQTWQSTKQAEETIRQSRAIMIFTVMTIIFLPLGFIASIFGMNNQQISGAGMPMTLQSQFRYMFPISTGIICVALVIAFSDYVRTVIWLVYKYCFTYTVTRSGLYDWVYLRFEGRSRVEVRKMEDRVKKMKIDVKAARQKRMNGQNRNTGDGDSGSKPKPAVTNIAGDVETSKDSGSGFRFRTLRVFKKSRDREKQRIRDNDEEADVLPSMENVISANPTSAGSTVPPTPARASAAQATSAVGPLEP